MVCPYCHEENPEGEQYCRYCGEDLTGSSSRSLVPFSSRLPAVLHSPQLPRIAAGVGALAVGVGLELLRRSLVARATRALQPASNALPVVSKVQDMLSPQNEKTLRVPKNYEVQETIVYIQRVIRRRI